MATPAATPQRDHVVALRDGRELAYAEWGPADGVPIVLMHGMPGSRCLCPDTDATEQAAVRLLTIDRPGYGRSTPCPNRALLSWVGDYAEWADLVGVPACPVVGWSSGGAYALACAFACPDRVTRVGLAASVAPVDESPGAWDREYAEVRGLVQTLRSDPDAARDGVRARVAWFEDGWATMLEPHGSTPDDEILRDPAVFGPLRDMMREGARQGVEGYVEDWMAELVPWQFSPAQVQHDVHVWWGDGDDLVPRPDAEYLNDVIPRATLTILPGQGHLALVPHWGEMLAAMLA